MTDMAQKSGESVSMVVNLTPDQVGRLLAVAFDVLNGGRVVPPSDIDLPRFLGSKMMGLVQDYEEYVGERLRPDVSSVQAAVDTGREFLGAALLNAQLAEIDRTI